MQTVVLLIISNVFMTFAWYGHLKFKHLPLWTVTLGSWGIALFEYCLMIPANRWGHGQFNAAQLKGMQEIITFCVFICFSLLFLGEAVRWNHLVGFVFLAIAGYFLFSAW